MNKAQNQQARGGSKASRKPKANKTARVKPPKSKTDNKVSAPASKGSVSRTNRPNVKGSPNGDIVIRHREYVADVIGSIDFLAVAYPINPGMPGTFPWLSTVATSYESYQFENLEFCYEPQCSTETAGTAIVAIDYDASDPAPVSKRAVMAYRNSVRSPSWSDCEQRSLSEDLHKQKSLFVRSKAPGADEDVRLYDVGNLFVCSQGQAGITAIGELYVEYTVKLMTPQLGIASVLDAQWARFTGVVNSAPFLTMTGNAPVISDSQGTTTSITAFIFNREWEGVFSLRGTGTGFTADVNVTPTGGTWTSVQNVRNTANTETAVIGTWKAKENDILQVTITNTTISNARVYFAQADV
jgi:hypothetical protein